MIDIAIVGDGRAAHTAAAVLEEAGANFCMFGASGHDGDLSRDRYQERRVTSVFDMGGSFSLLLGQDMLDARAVILAVGSAKVPALIGEEAFRGRGVSYCAECDADLYRNRPVAAVIDDPSLVHELDHLAERAASVLVVGEVSAPSSTMVLADGSISEISGDGRVESVTFDSGRRVPVAGVFLLRRELPAAVLVPGIETDAAGRVLADDEGRTNLVGCFAAGSCSSSAAGGAHVAASALAHIPRH